MKFIPVSASYGTLESEYSVVRVFVKDLVN